MTQAMTNQTAPSEFVLPMEVQVSLGFVAFTITVLNILVCLLVYFNRNLRTFTNGYVVSLAISDILVGAAFLPGYIAMPGQSMNGYLIAIILNVNAANISAVTYERWLAIINPLRYDYFMTKYFLKILITAWTLPIIISLIPLAWETQTQTTVHKVYLGSSIAFCILIPYAFTIYAYCRIFKEISRQVKNIKGQYVVHHSRSDEISLSRSDSNYNHPDSPTHKDKIIAERRRLSAEGKAALVFAIIAFIFAAAWLPVTYMTVCVIIGDFSLMPPQLSIISIYTLALNSVSNPFVYAFFKVDLKQAGRKHLKKIKQMCSRTHIPSSV